jgi:DNA-binding beta-propeller fold protein YncE
LVTGLFSPYGVAVDGAGHLYVANFGGTDAIGEYDANTGAVINASLVTGLNEPDYIALDGGNIYVADHGNHRIGEYNATTGAAINANLVTGLGGNQAGVGPIGIAIVPTVVPEPSNYILGLTALMTFCIWRLTK